MGTSASAIGTEFAPRIPATLLRLGDERLAGLVAGGHERAFPLLYERYHQPLYRYLRSMLGQDADAQDALQSAFASAFGALKAGRRNGPLRPWLFRIAHNEAITSLRRRRPHDVLEDTFASPAPSPEEQVIERERLRLLVADLGELTDRQRGALVMRELSGLSHHDIACALEMSVGAAKQTVFEARRALLELAEGRAMACEQVQRVISDGDMRALRGRKVRAHLRSCSGCAAFAASIRTRRVDLLALSPALPASAASLLFARITGAGFGHGGGGGGLLAAITGKTAGVVVSGKTFATGVAVIATTAVSAAGVLHQITATQASAPSRTDRSLNGRPAAGVSVPSGSRTARLGQAPGPAASPRIHHDTALGAGRLARRPSTASAHAAQPRATQAGASLALGRIVSQSTGAGGNSGEHAMRGRAHGSSHVRVPGSGASQRSAGGAHRARNPAGGRPSRARQGGSTDPYRDGRPGVTAPSASLGSRPSSAAGAPRLASSGTQLMPRAPSAK